MLDKTVRSRSRRSFLKLVPAAVGVGLAAPRPRSAGAEPQTSITKEDLEGAERIAGISFTDAEHELMRQSVATNHDHFDALRRVAIGYDVEPAFAFKPYGRLSGNGPASFAGRPTPNATLRVDRPRVAARPSDEDLAFMPVTSLAAMLESRVISSIELTELYLSRLKKFGDMLHCVVTLTEDRARAQAEQADREIRAGR